MSTIHEFDTVTLRDPHGPDGASLDLLTVPLGDLDPVRPSGHPHAPGPDRLAS